MNVLFIIHISNNLLASVFDRIAKSMRFVYKSKMRIKNRKLGQLADHMWPGKNDKREQRERESERVVERETGGEKKQLKKKYERIALCNRHLRLCNWTRNSRVGAEAGAGVAVTVGVGVVAGHWAQTTLSLESRR